MSFSASAVHLSLLSTMTPCPFSHHLLTFQLIPLLQNYFILTALWHIYKLLILPPFLYPFKPQTLILFLSSSDSRAHRNHPLTLSSLSQSIILMWQPASIKPNGTHTSDSCLHSFYVLLCYKENPYFDPTPPSSH